MEIRGGAPRPNPNKLATKIFAGLGLVATATSACTNFDLNRTAAMATWEADQTAFAQNQIVEGYHATQIAQSREAAATPEADYATDPVFCENVQTTVSDAAVKARGNLPENEVKGRDLWVGLNRDGDLHFNTLESILRPNNNSEMDLAYAGDAVCVSLDYDALTDYMGGIFLAQPQK
ncbi:hypothetical protein A2970_02205 [Candidatus Roizmanbacteria bacterium RIFCSPLOWO2_01_FULL_44_13]|uniref:Lipoprotein n=1 Tax=Candidatus Roizmanbacteria bacterium RIFCSPLOWO2_01_FULL_44_13 TaxID=1802069 RepID=A0A1F7JB49_9BACT|nr:MAG: hypothetical protein A2970_02205 [Candidatus Roizmanbacteria bacterium RIFCSPLOWO2_01_FULL_44_13]